MKFTDSVNKIKGVGSKRAELLNKLGLFTVEDLINHKPVYYKDLSELTSIFKMEEDKVYIIKGTVTSAPKWIKRTYKSSLFSFQVSDNTGTVEINIFNIPYFFNKYKIGDTYIFLGRVKVFHRKLQMYNPEVFDKDQRLGLIPYYPLTTGLSQNVLRRTIYDALDSVEYSDVYSDAFIEEYKLLKASKEFVHMHRPESNLDLSKAKRSLAMKEIIEFLQLLRLTTQKRTECEPLGIDNVILESFENRLSFKLTNAQKNACRDVLSDLNKGILSNRLIQGDVGSGKTMIAFFACYAVMSLDYQAVILAPTSLLAEQHYRNAQKLFYESDIALVTGATTEKERRVIYERLKTGEVRLLISTHAILYDHFPFRNLKLAVIDEQHRFGVEQRSFLMNEYPDIHKISMSATPIPRSLAMILNGSADISVVDEMPAGRKPVATFVLGSNKRESMFDWIVERIRAKNEKAYVVCSLLEDSEGVNAVSVMSDYEFLKKKYSDINIGFVHGKMKNDEKNDIMSRFKNGELSLIVATTVIEIGVDVSDATMIVIENADRFGLAQLHQLRGRVGRGSLDSFCYLVSGNAEAAERLKVLKDSNDGFLIARKDLEFRGAGNFFGTEQHGEMTFKYADIFNDMGLFEEANSILTDMPVKFAEDDEKLLERCNSLLSDKDKSYIII